MLTMAQFRTGAEHLKWHVPHPEKKKKSTDYKAWYLFVLKKTLTEGFSKTLPLHQTLITNATDTGTPGKGRSLRS